MSGLHRPGGGRLHSQNIGAQSALSDLIRPNQPHRAQLHPHRHPVLCDVSMLIVRSKKTHQQWQPLDDEDGYTLPIHRALTRRQPESLIYT